MQKIWVCGARGQIGQAVNDVVDKLEFEMLDTDVDDLDVTDTDEVLRFGEMNRPDIIINCSGMTDISSCEENPSQAFKVNALGARNLAIVAEKCRQKWYSFPRMMCLTAKAQSLTQNLTLQIRERFMESPSLRGKLCERIHNKTFYRAKHLGVWKGTEFYQWFLKKKVDAGEQLSIASDQFGSPTSANELARFLLHLVHTSEYGTYHATNKGVCSRYAFAQRF